LDTLTAEQHREQSAGRLRRRLKVLILHGNDRLSKIRRTSFNHAFCLLKYAPWNSYELHAFGRPIPLRLRQERFDVIMLDTTFLCWRWSKPRKDYFDRLLNEYSFIAQSEAIKIALPQDEYDHAAVLDEWLADWRVDLIYSVCYEYRNVFYPKASARAEIVEGMTGYVDDADIAMMGRLARPFEERDLDVGYRAKSLPPYFGRFGRLKAEMGEQFRASFAGTELLLDISVDPKYALMGDEWLHFLGNCRFTLGCESGSSLLDPTGEINHACASYLAENPNAEFEEIEAACFPGQDMQRIYSAISPRIFEAALAGTCQVLAPGRYMGILRPDEHYIPWDINAPDNDALYAELTDWRRAKERVEACREAVLGSERLSYRGFVGNLLDWIEAKLKDRGQLRHRPSGEIEPPTSGAELMHQLAEAAVRMAINGSYLAQVEEPYPPKAPAHRPVIERPKPISGVPKICLLALSAIADDPRVRRQGDLFAEAGWQVTAVGLAGGHSLPPVWPILSKSITPSIAAGDDAEPDPAGLVSSRVVTPPAIKREQRIRQLMAAHTDFVLWRKGVSARLARARVLHRSTFLAWRGFRFCVLFTLRIFGPIRRYLRKTAALARRSGWNQLAGLVADRDRLRKAIAYRRRMLRVRFHPDLAQEIYWKDLAISADLQVMYELARDIEADIWLANDWTALPLAARLEREKGGVYVYDTHELATEEYAEKPEWRRWTRPVVQALEGKYIRDARAVSAVSASIARRLDRLYALPRPTLVVRNTPNYERRAFRPTGHRIRVLYHGIVVPGRGLEIAIDSVVQWRSEFDLTIRGPENPQFTPVLRERIAARGLDGRVVLAPAVPMTALVQEAAAFDIGFFALPGHSRHNQFALPNKIFEYIMAGLCLCTTDLPEIGDLVRHFELGATIPTLDASAIATAINGLDRELIDDCKRNSLIAARELCWERESERLVSAYRALLRQDALHAA
jgi:glycosyltransferase involved in cell wall biosynthesis